MIPPSYSYPGSELDLFQHARNWKRYYASRLRPYIRGDVLEVGAGIGATSRCLCDGRQKTWTCLEPDVRLADRLRTALNRQPLPVSSRVVSGTLGDLPAEELFDTVLYIDVLEHIEDDEAELARCALRLRPGGHAIVLAPAHSWLFSPFDTAVGHHRRYTAGTLAQAAPREFQLVRQFYLDSVGMLASLMNRALLRAQHPKHSHIRLWDSAFIRASRLLDPLLGHRVGKTVIAVWTKTPAETSATRSGNIA